MLFRGIEITDSNCNHLLTYYLRRYDLLYEAAYVHNLEDEYHIFNDLINETKDIIRTIHKFKQENHILHTEGFDYYVPIVCPKDINSDPDYFDNAMKSQYNRYCMGYAAPFDNGIYHD